MKFFVKFSAVPAAILLAIASPAHAMLVEIGGQTGHNTSPTQDFTGNTNIPDISAIWNRTVTLGAGTGTYLGYGNGAHWVITATHVSSNSGTIHATDGKSYKLNFSGDPIIITNDGGGASTDIKLWKVSDDDKTATNFLGSLGNIGIFTGTLTTETPLYLLGTGRSVEIGGSFLDEKNFKREKQWGELSYDNYEDTGEMNHSYSNTHDYIEYFSKKENSVQAGVQDSGSGVFVRTENGWQIVSTTSSVAGNGGNNVGFAEDANNDSNKITYATYFSALPFYAEKINAITGIVAPEPAAFGLFAGTAMLVFAAARRRRKIRAR